MNIAIIGSRTINDYELIKNGFIEHYGNSKVNNIVSGGAIGVDSLAEQLADELKINKIIFKADWNKFGKSAGMIRNKLIVDNADEILAFWDKKSIGTKHTIELAKKQNKKVYII